MTLVYINVQASLHSITPSCATGMDCVCERRLRQLIVCRKAVPLPEVTL